MNALSKTGRPRVLRNLVVLLGIVGAACTPPVNRPPPALAAAEALQQLRAQGAALLALKAQARAETQEGGQRVRATLGVMAARPDRLRLTGENSLTGPLMTLATAANRFQLLDVQRNRFLEGEPSPCVVAMLIRIELSPRDAVDVLFGGAPLLADATEVRWEARGSGVLLLGDQRGHKERLQLNFSKTSSGQPVWDILQAQLTEPSGQVQWRVQHDSFGELTLAGAGARRVRLPESTIIEDVAHRSTVKLRWKERELNPTLPAGVFQLDAPQGVPREQASCGG